MKRYTIRRHTRCAARKHGMKEPGGAVYCRKLPPRRIPRGTIARMRATSASSPPSKIRPQWIVVLLIFLPCAARRTNRDCSSQGGIQTDVKTPLTAPSQVQLLCPLPYRHFSPDRKPRRLRRERKP